MAEWPNKGPTPGSYGHAIMTLAQGLEIAVAQKWMSAAEAKAEFRSNVRTLQEARSRKIARMEVEAQLNDLDEEENIQF